MAYSFLAANVLTNQVIASLPLRKANFTRALNDNGALSGEIAMNDTGVQAMQLLQNGALEPGGVALYVVRDQTFVWGGILWSHGWDSTQASLTVTGAEFGSYLAFRYIMSKVTYVGDRSTLAANWVAAAFADNGPPLTIASTLTGVSETQAFNYWEQHNVLDLLKSYEGVTSGYDWAFDVVPDGNGNGSAQLTISAPRRGVSQANTGIVWDYPGIESYTYVKDGTRRGSDVVVVGAGSGSSQLIGESQIVPSGLVKMTQIESSGDLGTQQAVNHAASGKLATYQNSPQILTATLSGDAFFGSGVGLGDEVILSIRDNFISADVPVRIISYQVAPQTESVAEQVSLTFGDIL